MSPPAGLSPLHRLNGDSFLDEDQSSRKQKKEKASSLGAVRWPALHFKRFQCG